MPNKDLITKLNTHGKSYIVESLGLHTKEALVQRTEENKARMNKVNIISYDTTHTPQIMVPAKLADAFTSILEEKGTNYQVVLFNFMMALVKGDISLEWDEPWKAKQDCGYTKGRKKNDFTIVVTAGTDPDNYRMIIKDKEGKQLNPTPFTMDDFI